MRTLEFLVTGHYRQAAKLVAATDADAALTLYLSKADPLLVLRDLLGHSSVLTTEKYLRRLDTTRIYRDAYERAGAAEGLIDAAAAERIRHGVRRRAWGRGGLMPANVVGEPVGITCVFSDGSRAEFRLDGLPELRLTRDLLVGLVELIHPHGAMDAAGSVQHYVGAIRHMVRTLSALGFSGGAGDLTRVMLVEYWMGVPGRLEACTRRMLQGFHAATGGLVDPAQELVAGRAFNLQPNHRQLPPYSEAEWDRLTQTCRRIIDESFATHKRALAAAEHGRHPRENGWSKDNLRWLLARIGPVGSSPSGSTWAAPSTWCASVAVSSRQAGSYSPAWRW